MLEIYNRRLPTKIEEPFSSEVQFQVNRCINLIDCSFIFDLCANLDFFFCKYFLTGYIVNQLAECFTLYKYYKMK